MIKNAIGIGATLSLVGLAAAFTTSGVRADDSNKQATLTFAQPTEAAGHMLPAGIYTFKLADSMADRHIVQILDAKTMLTATVMAVPDYALKQGNGSTVTFANAPAGSNNALRAWFYPGDATAEELVYSGDRAKALAKESNTVVPMLGINIASDDDLRTAPILAVTPRGTEFGVGAVIQTTSPNAPKNPTPLTPLSELDMAAGHRAL